MTTDMRELKMNDTFNENDIPKYIKSLIFVKGFAVAKNLQQTIIALSVARRLHEGQYRKDGMPYISHPLKVCTTLISYGVDDDVTLAAALLHDVLEDCQLPLKGRELISEFSISEEVLDIITLLTKESGLDSHELNIYFKKIEGNHKAALIKLADRLHNSSTLYTFTFEKMEKYIKETNDYILPMASYCKNYYPQYTNAFTILKSNIFSLNNSMNVMLKKFQEYSEKKGE